MHRKKFLDNSNMDIKNAGCTFIRNWIFWDMPKEYVFPTKVKIKNGLIFQLHTVIYMILEA